jgi:hypothetical protein
MKKALYQVLEEGLGASKKNTAGARQKAITNHAGSVHRPSSLHIFIRAGFLLPSCANMHFAFAFSKDPASSHAACVQAEVKFATTAQY